MKPLGEILSKSVNVDISEVPEGQSDPLDELEPGVCPICRGAGFVRRNRPVDHPRFGKAEPCSCVLDEAVDERRHRLERLSNLGTLTRFVFADLEPGGRDGDDTIFERATDAAQQFAAEPEGWLVLSGPSGCGKTHLAAAIANERIRLGSPVLFMVVPDLLDLLRGSYDANEGELDYELLFNQVRNAPLLVLDDIDASAPTAWATEKLFQIINHRYNAQLPTVFTTGRPVHELDDRLASRLSDPRTSQVFALGSTGASYRQLGGMTLDRLREKTFANFAIKGAGTTQREWDSLASAFRASQQFAQAPHGWLMLQGVNGCGKTHLAAAIANEVIRDGGSAYFAVVPDLLDHLRASYAPNQNAAYDEVFEAVRSADLLILDDLGAQHSSPWAQEKLYQIVNYRTVRGLPGVVTTDRSDEQFRGYHERIFARIGDFSIGTTLRITAPHYTLGRFSEPERGGRGRR